MHRGTKHGLSRTPEYHVWKSLIRRCTNKKDAGYKNYGARGIRVCAQWVASVENFVSDMGLRPSPAHSIDRIDNESDYSPENCRWATWDQQNRNKRDTRNITHMGRTQSTAEWAREVGMTKQALRYRLNAGWSMEDALAIPITPGGAYARTRTKNPK